MSEPRAALIYTPLPDVTQAREIAATLVRERLVACANIIGGVESIFSWNGEIDSANETAVLFKTTDAQLEAAIARLSGLHPYETPAIVGTVCDTAHPATLDWLAQQTG